MWRDDTHTHKQLLKTLFFFLFFSPAISPFSPLLGEGVRRHTSLHSGVEHDGGDVARAAVRRHVAVDDELRAQ